MLTTFHLAPADDWATRPADAPWTSPSLGSEGFIHCTTAWPRWWRRRTVTTARQPGDFVVLTVDLERTGSPWRFDDPARIYPHVYGPIAPEAILGAAPIERDPEGTFVGFVPSP